MTVLWRTDGVWGIGLGRDLNADEIDGNFWDHEQRITLLESTIASSGKTIDFIEATSNVLTIHYTDHSTDNVTVPMTIWSFQGEWAPATNYATMDIFTINGSVYLVLLPHLSAGSFDPGADDGSGHDLYGLMLTWPANVLPTEGDAGMSLRKSSDDDFDVEWFWERLDLLQDVGLTSPLVPGQVLGWSGSIWTNADVTLPPPGSGEMGGVEARVAVATEFVTGLGTDGIMTAAQPAFSDVSGQVGEDQLLQTTKQVATQSGGSITLDRASGEVIATTISANITAITLTGWPAAGVLGRIVWDLTNTGAFTVAGHPGAVIKPGGVAPTMSSGTGKKDRWIYSSWDAGATVFLDVVGQNYA